MRMLRTISGWIDAHRPPSLSIALLAPDGAGKSTLADKLNQNFYFPVCTFYMGLYSKQYKRSRLAIMPGFDFLQRMFRLWKNYLYARYQMMRRKLVVFDRYPYDTLLKHRQNRNLFKRFRHWLLTHPSPAPDLVILLDAPGETLYARKGEHSPGFLEEQRQSYLRLIGQLPHSFVVDAACDAGRVYQQVVSIIWNGYLYRQSN
jgi:thymidylate kinase